MSESNNNNNKDNKDKDSAIDIKLRAYGEQYRKHIIEIAKEEEFIIPIKDTNNNMTVGEWEELEYERHKLLREDYDKVQTMIKALVKLEDKRSYLDEEDDEDYEDLDTEILNKTLELYQFKAQCYLNMSSNDFYHSDWTVIKDVLNACDYRTYNTLPTYSHGLQKLFYEGKAHLTETENEFFEMYRLWKKWHTKPWEINGGRIYPEDWKTMLKLEEFETDSSKKESQKSSQKAGIKERAAQAFAKAAEEGGGI